MTPAALGAAAVAIVLVMTATAVITRRTGKAAYVDAAWGGSFVAAAWAAAAISGWSLSRNAWLLLVLVTLWGARLTWHLGRRVRRAEHDDPRYENFLGGPIARVPFRRVVVKVFGLQALLVVVVALPVVAGVAGASAMTWPVVPGVLLWLIGVVFEAVADAQLAAFREDPHRPALLTSGLWACSRHPNYFGDFCVWWGFWLIGAAASGVGAAVATLVSPVVMSWILIRVSGVRLAEERMHGRPGWAAYAARTPIFVPWRPNRNSPSSKGIRAE